MPIPNTNKYPALSKIVFFILLMIVLLSAFIRFSYYYSLCSDPLPTMVSASDIFDQHRFIELAKELLSTRWLGTGVTRYSPAYSYFIAVTFKIFGQDMYHVFFIQFLIGAFVPLLYYKTTSLLSNNRAVGLASAFMAAVYSPMIFFEGTLLRASLIAFLNLLSFYVLLTAVKNKKTSHYFWAGLATGLSVILRPNILPLALIPYVFAVTKGTSKKIQYTLLLSAGILIAVTPLAVRNKMLKKDVLISSQGPSTFWIGNTYDSSGIGLWRSPLRDQLAQEAQGSVPKTVKILFREIQRHPLAYFELYRRKVTMYFNAYEIPGNLSFDQFWENHPPLRWAFLNFSILCPLALMGLFLCWRKYPLITLCYLYFIVLSASNVLFHIQGRYRIPCIPFFIIFASLGGYELVHRLKHRTLKPAAIIAFLIFSILPCPNNRIIHKYFGGPIRKDDFNNRFIAYYLLYQAEGRGWSLEEKQAVITKALHDQKKALNTVPLYDNIYLSYRLAEQHILLNEVGMRAEAELALNGALRLNPSERQKLLNKISAKHINYKRKSLKDLSFRELTAKKGFKRIF